MRVTFPMRGSGVRLLVGWLAIYTLVPAFTMAQLPAQYRSIDGTENNPGYPDWGSAGTDLVRLLEPDYPDGTGSPAGENRPSARLISNTVSAQQGSRPNALGVSDFVWQWGQFLDHDIDLTPVVHPSEPFDILVPKWDPFFDPFGNGDVVIPLDRSFFRMVWGVRQQVNGITAYIDASNVYGSDSARALELRTLDGTGRLKTSPGGLLPFNENGFPNAPDSSDPTFFLAGDFRANEQVALTAMHTLFVREHNHWARTIRKVAPSASGEEIYQLVRAMVGAEMQVITYEEFLPVLLGPGALGPYSGYEPAVNPGISNVFATAAYRFGHSMLSPTLLRLDRHGQPIEAGHLPLAESFFNPSELIDHGIESLLRGLASQLAQEIDTLLVDDVRNFLFGPPGAGGFDLAALNIQRGRDHGLPSYNQTRVELGLSPASNFSDISSDPQVQAGFASVYQTVDDVDLWIAGLAEDHVPGGLVGETFSVILKDQFERLRNCDRFWYETHLPPLFRRWAKRQTLAKIIRRNTRIGGEIGPDVFMAKGAKNRGRGK